jgi:amino acid transporter
MGNSVELWVIMVIVFWLVTLFNFLPMKRVILLNIVGAIFGMILPAILLIAGAIYYLINGESEITYTGMHDFVPVASLATFALMVKTLSAYSGIQSVAFHMKNIDNPQQKIPVSLMLATIVIVSVTVLATISLMIIIPVDKVNVLNGLVQGVSKVLDRIGFSAMEPVVALMIGLGMLASLSTWILGPARGMQAAAEQKLFPKILSGQNKSGMPVNMLIIQVLIGMALSSLFLIMPSIYSAFALLIALTSQFTVLMWAMVFISALRLRYTRPNQKRVFHIGPRGKNWLLIIVVIIAFCACGIGFVSGLFPPGFSQVKSMGWYIMLVVSADVVIIIIPLLWVWFHHKTKIN